MIGKIALHYRIIEQLGAGGIGRLHCKTYSNYRQRTKSLSVA